MKKNSIVNTIQTKKSANWQRTERSMRFKLFHNMARRIPAYKHFLRDHGIKPGSIKTNQDLNEVPPITKDNYLRQYSLREKSWDGTLHEPTVLTATSGSTGAPVFFSRNNQLIDQSALIHQMFLHNKGFNTKKPTLVIDAFGMGVWIGGLITYQAFEKLQQQGYPITIITPGINMAEIIKIFRDIAPEYSQILLAGYPPFIKDVIDQLPLQQINYRHANLRLLFAAEPFTDGFRKYVTKAAKLEDPLFDTANIYGSADLGTMAFETPQSILVRSIATKKKSLFHSLFPNIRKTPTLAQYIPAHISFENSSSGLLVTGNNSLPLFKYAIGDHGGVYTHNEVMDTISTQGVSVTDKKQLKKIEKHSNQLPFVYVYERMDFSTTIYGVNIYPETIREVLFQKPYAEHCTGKFSMLTKFNDAQDQYLEINIELQPKTIFPRRYVHFLQNDIAIALQTKSAEFKELYKHLGSRATPVVVPWKNADPTHFTPGIKQKWVK